MIQQLRTIASRLLTPCILLSVFCLSVTALSAQVISVKENRVIIKTDGLAVAEGDSVFLLNDDGKRVGILEITKVSGEKAAGNLKKGKAETGFKVKAKDDKKGKAAGGSRTAFGLLLGLTLNSQTVNLAAGTETESVEFAGSGFGAYLALNVEASSAFTLRGIVGYESFNVAGSRKLGTCPGGTSKDCVTTISYLTAEGWGHLNLFGSKTKFWIGAGGEFLVPLSSSTTTLDASSVSTTFAYGPGIGIDIGKIPFEFNYMMLPSSSDVKTTVMRVRAGILF